MYRDVVQWTGIRRRILQEGSSIRQVVRETGLSRNMVRKMLKHPLPKLYGPRSRFWEDAYDLLIALEKKDAIDFLFLLSRADPPVISPERTEQFFRDAARNRRVTPSTGTREQARQVACEWMRAVLQKEISPDALRREVGDVRDFSVLLHRLYEGRLSDRNRSMVVLAAKIHRGAARPAQMALFVGW